MSDAVMVQIPVTPEVAAELAVTGMILSLLRDVPLWR
jgi:hypothetical protein